MQPLLFKLLALVEHLLHVLIVGLSALVQLIQDLCILFFGLSCKIIFYNQLTVSSATLACQMTFNPGELALHLVMSGRK